MAKKLLCLQGAFSPAGATEPSTPPKHTGTENRHLQAPSAFPTSRPAMISPGLPCLTFTLLPSNPHSPRNLAAWSYTAIPLHPKQPHIPWPKLTQVP